MAEIFVGFFVLLIIGVFSKKPDQPRDLNHIIPIIDILDGPEDKDCDYNDSSSFDSDEYYSEDNFDEFDL